MWYLFMRYSAILIDKTIGTHIIKYAEDDDNVVSLKKCGDSCIEWEMIKNSN